MHTEVVFYVLLIDFLAVLSPGPDFFMVLKNSMTVSRKAGIYTTLGITSGCVILFTISLLGVGIIVASSRWLFLLIKTVGALYLTYIAIKSIFAKVTIEEPQLIYSENLNTPSFEYYKVGLLCNLTNPKAFMFIVSVSTYAIVHGGNNITDILAIIIGSGIATIAWFSLVSFLFGNFTIRKIFYKKQRVINILFALILLYLAFTIITMK